MRIRCEVSATGTKRDRLPHWTAERVQGTAIRYLAAATARELADLIAAAEARWVASASGPDWRDPGDEAGQ